MRLLANLLHCIYIYIYYSVHELSSFREGKSVGVLLSPSSVVSISPLPLVSPVSFGGEKKISLERERKRKKEREGREKSRQASKRARTRTHTLFSTVRHSIRNCAERLSLYEGKSFSVKFRRGMEGDGGRAWRREGWPRPARDTFYRRGEKGDGITRVTGDYWPL